MYKTVLFLVLFLNAIVFASAQQTALPEEIRLTTYYPSPYGSYRELSANRMKIGQNYSAQAVADDNLIVEGSVGIGTTALKERLHLSDPSSAVAVFEKSSRPVNQKKWIAGVEPGGAWENFIIGAMQDSLLAGQYVMSLTRDGDMQVPVNKWGTVTTVNDEWLIPRGSSLCAGTFLGGSVGCADGQFIKRISLMPAVVGGEHCWSLQVECAKL